ncbi:hypothetical protein F542_14810 [Bibersteinia trehalosi USDA-ARS-USMARC-188]|uniref:Uncharacterized protein n=3 Tax=Bibersteinia trehalosi TaxID=47735 RepID=W0R6S2_BIBTR|nr:hypothetical protein WQG_7240 [Bibersteinia trehalosi USDA-ARS-USMARC-192]AHG82197.1 hypothetical protein F542_14810 [Bibersteinia trehalosi USDA-ARS-USMARC-188]AHG84510.1 hypothetical protein F543_16480 [Bibersteinia trehalosi USDA-ARS-USMARC-189]AHG85990.1 hypothetical protein F544_7590 [Bibersteinia trehalosi USDA-ARS-USMARC-190]
MANDIANSYLMKVKFKHFPLLNITMLKQAVIFNRYFTNS